MLASSRSDLREQLRLAQILLADLFVHPCRMHIMPLFLSTMLTEYRQSGKGERASSLLAFFCQYVKEALARLAAIYALPFIFPPPTLLGSFAKGRNFRCA